MLIVAVEMQRESQQRASRESRLRSFDFEDGGVILAELRIDGPGRFRIAVDVGPTGRPFCSKVARGLISRTGVALPLPPFASTGMRSHGNR